MSKPRYDWWSYVKGMIRRYPELRRRYGALREGRLTADYSGMPRGGGDGRAVEGLAIRGLSPEQVETFLSLCDAIQTNLIPQKECAHAKNHSVPSQGV